MVSKLSVIQLRLQRNDEEDDHKPFHSPHSSLPLTGRVNNKEDIPEDGPVHYERWRRPYEASNSGAGPLCSSVQRGKNGPLPEPNKTPSSRSLIFMLQSKHPHVHNWGLSSLPSIRQLGEHQNFENYHWCPVLFTDERPYKLNSKNKVTLTFPRLQDWLFLNQNTPTHCLVVFSVSQSFILIVRKLLRQTSLTLVFLFFFKNLFHVGCVLQAPEVPTAASTVTVTWDLSSGLYSPLNTTSTPSMKTECTPKPT